MRSPHFITLTCLSIVINYHKEVSTCILCEYLRKCVINTVDNVTSINNNNKCRKYLKSCFLVSLSVL